MRISFQADGSCSVESADGAWRFPDADQTVKHLPWLRQIAGEHEDAELLDYLSAVAAALARQDAAFVGVWGSGRNFEIVEAAESVTVNALTPAVQPLPDYAAPIPEPVRKPAGLFERVRKILGLEKVHV